MVAELNAAGFNVTTAVEAMGRAFGRYVKLDPVLTSYYVDWWLLGAAGFRVLVTSHSSFSRTAALMNPHYPQAALFYAPDAELQTIAPFDPWNSTYDARAFGRVGASACSRLRC